MNNPCILCGDRCVCNTVCLDLMKYWNYIDAREIDSNIVVKHHTRKIITINKHGIRKEIWT